MKQMKYEPGIYEITNDEYHASEGLSRSMLMSLRKSPYHFWFEHINEEYIKPESKEAYIFGSMFHTLILEPYLFDKTYAILPELDRRTKKGKEDYEIFKENNVGKIIITHDQFDQASQMQKSFNNHSKAKNFLEDSKREMSLFWTDKETEILCKSRPDIWRSNMVVDLKTTESAAYRDCQNDCFKYGYHIQAAMIQAAILNTMGAFMETFVLISCEKKAPYAVSINVIDKEAIDYGSKEFRNLLYRYIECHEKNEWPAYETNSIKLPSYYKYETIDN
jgi:PDDEXK-like domain of unknown function (DUF3799)